MLPDDCTVMSMKLKRLQPTCSPVPLFYCVPVRAIFQIQMALKPSTTVCMECFKNIISIAPPPSKVDQLPYMPVIRLWAKSRKCCVSNQETVGSHVEFTYKFILRLQSNKKR